MDRIRKQFSNEFKAKVAMEALKEQKTMAELSSEYSVHPTQINQWKKELKEAIPSLFARGKSGNEKNQEKVIDELYKRIGQLEVENNWFKKKLCL